MIDRLLDLCPRETGLLDRIAHRVRGGRRPHRDLDQGAAREIHSVPRTTVHHERSQGRGQHDPRDDVGDVAPPHPVDVEPLKDLEHVAP
jgi:hypothetical protein